MPDPTPDIAATLDALDRLHEAASKPPHEFREVDGLGAITVADGWLYETANELNDLRYTCALRNAYPALRTHIATLLIENAIKRDSVDALRERLAEAEGERDAAIRAIETIRDSVLHGRHQLADYEIDSDVTNAVLGIIDDASPPESEATRGK